MERKRLYDAAALVFALGVLVFGLVRASNELRWSGWAPGDAQTLSAALHFADEGFIEHRFLTYLKPGYLGAVYPAPVYNWWWDGYYTHSPPLYAIINGVILRLGGDRYAAQAFSVFLSALALAFFYIFACYFFRRPVALIATIVIGLSVVFLEHMDGLSRQTYDIPLVFGAMSLFAAVEHGGLWRDRPRLRSLALAGVWLLVFLQALNSREYLFFLQLFFLGYYLLKRARPFPFKKMLLLAAAPLAGIFLHILLISWVAGGIVQGWHDFWQVLSHRVTGTAVLARVAPAAAALDQPLSQWLFSEMRLMDSQFSDAFGFGLVVLPLLPLFVRFLECYENPRDFFRIKWGFTPTNIIIWLGIGFLAWRVVAFEGPEIYQPAHGLALVGLLFGLAFTFFLSNAWGTFWGHLQPRAPHSQGLSEEAERALLKFAAASLPFMVIIALFSVNTIRYFSEYPNLISPQRTWLVYTPTEKLSEQIEVARMVRKNTSYGDIVFHNLGSEWVWGVEPLPLFDEYFRTRSLVLGRRLQEVKKVEVVDGDLDKAYGRIQPSYIRYEQDGQSMIDGLPDDGFLYTYQLRETPGPSTYLAGVRNFQYRLARLRELRSDLLKQGRILADQIKYYALISKTEASSPLGRYFLEKYYSEEVTPNYRLVHLDRPRELPFPIPQAHWPLDGVPGTRAWDVSPWQRHLSLQGSYQTVQEGRVDQAVEFGGDTAGDNDLFGLYLEGEGAVAFWVHPFEEGTSSSVIAFSSDGESNLFLLGLEGGRLVARIADTSYYSQSALPVNAWTHGVVAWSEANQTLRVYLNGALDAVYQGARVPVAGEFANFVRLGGSFSGPAPGYRGYLDEVAIFDQDLSPRQVEVLYEQGLDKSRAWVSLEQVVGAGDPLGSPDWVKFSPMDIRPDAEPRRPWQMVGSFDAVFVSDGILSIETSGRNAGQFTHPEPRFDNAKGLTAEIRIKVLEASTEGFQGAAFAVQDGTREVKITFYPDRISVRDQNEERAVHRMSPGDAFHVYRIAMKGDKAEVYVDDQPIASVTLVNRVPYKAVIVGDLSPEPGENISAQIDYVIYNVEEALAPMPRPGEVVTPAPEAPQWKVIGDIKELPGPGPDSPWALAGTFEIAEASAHGLTLKTIDNSVGFFARFDQDLSNSVGSTAEMAVKLLEDPAEEENAVTFSVQDGRREGSLVIRPDRISVRDGGEEKAVIEMDTRDNFHTYRLALVKDVLTVFVDGRAAAEVALTNPVRTKAILWGDISPEPGKNMRAQVKRLAYTVAGALAPDGRAVSPPPATGAPREVPGLLSVSKVSDMRVAPDREEVLPWSAGGTFDIAQASNGILTIKTSGRNAAWFVRGEDRLENATGTTVEVRLRLLEASHQGFQGATMYVQDGAREGKITFYPDRIAIRDVNDEKASHPMDTTDAFHIYRMAMKGDRLEVSVDGAVVAAITLSNPITSKGILVGDLSTEGGENIHAAIDYVAYSVEGAFVAGGAGLEGQGQ